MKNGKNHKNQVIRYLLSDVFSSLLGWTFFYAITVNNSSGKTDPGFILDPDPMWARGVIIYIAYWLALYLLWGFYRDIFRRSRLKELGSSLAVTTFGCMIVFLIITSTYEVTGSPENYLNIFITLFIIHFLFSYIPRLLITSGTINKIRKGIIGFNTLIIGSDKKAVGIYKEIIGQIRPTGNKFIGFININGGVEYPMSRYLEHLGGLDRISDIIENYYVEEVIIAIESTEHGKIEKIINRLDNRGLVIRAIPGMHDILTGKVRIDTILETPLIQISHRMMPVWQSNMKQALDILVSFTALLLLLPVSIIITAWIKLSSRGPVIYSHERIGKSGKPFNIYKFRTMIVDAEKNGPELSSDNDHRITRPGRFLRRIRFDEIPNFINVLKGDMSLVGPRPERRYYIDLIVKRAPHYNLLLKIKPGITSLGQVKYGYAENVEQMIQRLRYDMIYLENMSIFVDFQILILTVLTIFKRKGV